jgi:hypothetical protein
MGMRMSLVSVSLVTNFLVSVLIAGCVAERSIIDVVSVVYVMPPPPRCGAGDP